jgi:hypothetical protein
MDLEFNEKIGIEFWGTMVDSLPLVDLTSRQSQIGGIVCWVCVIFFA